MPQSTVITALVAAFPGMSADASDGTDNYITRISGETTLQLPWGALVMQGANDDQCVSFTSQTGKPLGMVSYSAAYQINHELATVADSNGNIGLLPNITVKIKRRGRMWVQIDENVTPTSHVRARTTNVSTGVGPGSFRASSSAGVTNDFSKAANWCGTYPASGGIGLLEFDFTAAYSVMTAD